ncbi:DNA cytosine methyltransferase [Pseudoalteromonas sp. T1lg75]|uniref:DNA cytosine methyltransferase n=1 Tax=Pseudoalteromonas sp. T1lg75 TaxID=2077102 RepID=UPI000CF6ED7F|nr:DNA cytosine methyltransferase [Pseudoalteromonas sp. T1lg75]
MKTIEMCAGAGGQALGLHNAGFEHEVLIEIDEHACSTLRFNNEKLNLGWNKIVEGDLKDFANFSAAAYQGEIALVAGGVPCPPFSKAGKQLGADDERDLFPTALKIVQSVKPLMVMLENVPGLAESKFQPYRDAITSHLSDLGYLSEWKVLQASDFGVPQLRPRMILVAVQKPHFKHFEWPEPIDTPTPTVGDALFDMMSEKGWEGVERWREMADGIAPTLVGGSKKHGGPDLGPTRAKAQWQALGVNGHRVGSLEEVPGPGFKGVLMRNGTIRPGTEGMPLLTVPMAAKIQGFPADWSFVGNKTNAYRQVGNAFPPPVAQAVGEKLMEVLRIVQGEYRAA